MTFKRDGFTLIELLVVIAIIGALSSLLVPNFMGARERARDNQRKSDLKQLQKAMEMYRQDQTDSSYPASLPAVDTTWTNAAGTTTYMNKIPKDPISGNAYYYARQRVVGDNLTYTLCACLENTADADSASGDCDGSTYQCSSGKKYVVTEP
ncbi:prepilin-type N-terminal cleavage/methylation domain-containing protein [Patescibacteria group bacterium]|nr:prepilin-type N-terminal cleavage/methylation domain-containing protein [Patescibacteria group bacterium]MCL5091861.1 prepilin-type N-terminal cleavage/methylation domain-containing protein [Patescibacteria group bacterium]